MERKWKEAATKNNQKPMPVAKTDFSKNRALATAGARQIRSRGSKSGVQIDKKDRSTFAVRDGEPLGIMFYGYCWIWGTGRERNWNQTRCKEASKNEEKKTMNGEKKHK